MVRIQGQKYRAELSRLDSQALPVLNLSDFLLDRYEVTNRRFKEFVQAGGYKKPEYWKHKFVKDGSELSWQAAMKLFVDQTGQPGPATWENGDFPEARRTTRSEASVGMRLPRTPSSPASACPRSIIGAWPPEIPPWWMSASSSR